MKEAIALGIISKYYFKHGFIPKRLYPQNYPLNTKVPDFEIVNNKILDHYCEVKSPELILNPVTNLFHWQTTVSKLRNMIHKTIKQFRGVDPNHNLPWILAFTSDRMELNWTNLVHTVNGIAGFSNTIFRDFRDTRFIKDTQGDIEQLDYIFWNQVNRLDNKIYQFVPFINIESKHLVKVENINRLLTPLSDENIVDGNTRRY